MLCKAKAFAFCRVETCLSRALSGEDGRTYVLNEQRNQPVQVCGHAMRPRGRAKCCCEALKAVHSDLNP